MPVIDASKNQLINIDFFRVDLDVLPLEALKVDGKGEKLFKMSISCANPNAKIPRYQLTVPIMPNRVIEAVVIKGEFKAKSHIGNSKCNVQRVFVNMDVSDILGKKIPEKIHYIEFYGSNHAGEPVKERIHRTLSEIMGIVMKQ